MQLLTSDQLLAITGGAGNAPLGGNVTQDINTNWGGTQTNIENQTTIGTQIVNPAPAPAPYNRFEYLRQHPEARYGAPPYKPTPIRR